MSLAGMNYRRDIVKSLTERVPDLLDWKEALPYACDVVEERFNAPEPLVDLSRGEIVPQEYLVSYREGTRTVGMVPADAPILLQGDGGSLKTWIALSISLACELGEDVGPFAPKWSGVHTLYLDWEADENTLRRRWHRLALGHGVPPPTIFYRRCVAPMTDMVATLRQDIAANNIGLVIVDSIASAVTGDLVKSDSIIPFYNAIRASASCTFLVISHVSKAAASSTSSEPQSAFGSVQVRNRARGGFEVKVTDATPTVSTVAITQEKMNDGATHRNPFGVTYTFVDPDGSITAARINGHSDALDARMTIADRLLRILGDGHPHSTADLAASLATTPATLRVTLSRLHDRGKIVSFPGPNGTPSSWGLADQHHGLSIP
jgi:hypothetical protein